MDVKRELIVQCLLRMPQDAFVNAVLATLDAVAGASPTPQDGERARTYVSSEEWRVRIKAALADGPLKLPQLVRHLGAGSEITVRRRADELVAEGSVRLTSGRAYELVVDEPSQAETDPDELPAAAEPEPTQVEESTLEPERDVAVEAPPRPTGPGADAQHLILKALLERHALVDDALGLTFGDLQATTGLPSKQLSGALGHLISKRAVRKSGAWYTLTALSLSTLVVK